MSGEVRLRASLNLDSRIDFDISNLGHYSLTGDRKYRDFRVACNNRSVRLEMQRRQGLRTHSVSRLPAEILADPVSKAQSISETLPVLIEEAERAGLSIIAQHLTKALILARRVAASVKKGSLSN